MAKKLLATLEQGRTYTFGGVKFTRNVPRPVTEELAELLSTKKLTETTTQGRTVELDLFSIEEVESKDAGEEEGKDGETATPARTRGRSGTAPAA